MGIGIAELAILLGALLFIALIVIVPIILLVVIIKQSSARKGKMGINVNTVHCPNCNTKMPAIRTPKNLRQAMWGGWTCPDCKTELDKWGQPVLK